TAVEYPHGNRRIRAIDYPGTCGRGPTCRKGQRRETRKTRNPFAVPNGSGGVAQARLWRASDCPAVAIARCIGVQAGQTGAGGGRHLDAHAIGGCEGNGPSTRLASRVKGLTVVTLWLLYEHR